MFPQSSNQYFLMGHFCLPGPCSVRVKFTHLINCLQHRGPDFVFVGWLVGVVVGFLGGGGCLT